MATSMVFLIATPIKVLKVTLMEDLMATSMEVLMPPLMVS